MIFISQSDISGALFTFQQAAMLNLAVCRMSGRFEFFYIFSYDSYSATEKKTGSSIISKEITFLAITPILFQTFSNKVHSQNI